MEDSRLEDPHTLEWADLRSIFHDIALRSTFRNISLRSTFRNYTFAVLSVVFRTWSPRFEATPILTPVLTSWRTVGLRTRRERPPHKMFESTELRSTSATSTFATSPFDRCSSDYTFAVLSVATRTCSPRFEATPILTPVLMSRGAGGPSAGEMCAVYGAARPWSPASVQTQHVHVVIHGCGKHHHPSPNM